MRFLIIAALAFLVCFSPLRYILSETVDVEITINVFQCGDGIDNDSDGFTDYPDDPGCSSVADDDETDIFQCGDGIDNDSDGFTDYPDDPGCGSVTDDDEYNEPTNNSGGGGGGGNNKKKDPGNNQVVLRGRAFPGSTIILFKDSEEVARTTAKDDASFSATIDTAGDRTHTLSIISQNAKGYRSPLFSFPINLSANVVTEIDGLFLAPVFTSDKKEVRKGDPITFFGFTAPNADVIISLHSEKEIILNTKSNEDGSYLYNFDSSKIEYGKHTARPRAISFEDNSPLGELLTFEVSDKNILRNSPKGENHLKGDINNDRRVNLVDFSIAAFWWKRALSQEMINNENRVLNSDNKIDLTDFSIMAYYWTG